MTMSAQVEIDRLAERRQEIWCSGDGEAAEVVRITARLSDLYDQKRHERTAAFTGARRTEIVRQARVESELERLMSDRSR